MTDWIREWKVSGNRGAHSSDEILSRHLLEGLRKTTENLNEDK
jgi:hypothetical protein